MTTSGLVSPHAALTHGHCVLTSGLWPVGFGYWSTMPTGLVPNARMAWSSVYPTETTRAGVVVIVVDPKACSTVTGKVPPAAGFASDAGVSAEPQAVSRLAPTITAATAVPHRFG